MTGGLSCPSFFPPRGTSAASAWLGLQPSRWVPASRPPRAGSSAHSAFRTWCGVGFFFCFLLLFVFALFVLASFAGNRSSGLCWAALPLGAAGVSCSQASLRVRLSCALSGTRELCCPAVPYLRWACLQRRTLTLACLGYCLLSPWPPPSSVNCCPSGQASAYSAPYFFCPKKRPH